MHMTPRQREDCVKACREFDWSSVEWERLSNERLFGAVAVACIPPLYDPDFGDDKLCVCGHPYSRHFDPYEDMDPVGCKYCQCSVFVLDEAQQGGQ